MANLPRTANPLGNPIIRGGDTTNPRMVNDGTGGPGVTPPQLNNNGGNNPQVMPAFMPGQLSALAQQMNFGFGDGQDKWRDYLRQTNDPTPVQNFNYANFGAPVKHHNKGGNGDDGGGGGNGGGGGKDDYNPPYTHNSGVPQGALAGMPQGILAAAPQAMQPQGILAGAQPMPVAGPVAATGSLPPQVLAMLRARMMGG